MFRVINRKTIVKIVRYKGKLIGGIMFNSGARLYVL